MPKQPKVISTTEEKKETLWLFLKVSKQRVITTTQSYTIFKVGKEDRTCIISNKFRRKKEGEEHIYFSIPDNFILKLRLTAKNEDTNEYCVVNEKEVNAWDLLKLVNEDNKIVPHKPTAEELEDMFVEHNQ